MTPHDPSTNPLRSAENRLGRETSPYLLQHRHNPVAWWPWGPDALAEAQRHDKPILLSVGYAACHWCHVMAHESFEDDATAAVMNDLFVNIKVDREERPGHRPDLHVGTASSGRAGRLAADHVPDAEGRAGLGRDLFPEDVAVRPAGIRRRAARSFAAVPRGTAQNRSKSRRADGAAGEPGAAGREGRGRRAKSSTSLRCRSSAPSTSSTAACAARRNFPTPRCMSWSGARACAPATSGSSS